MKLLVLFLAGVVTGACLAWLCMRATLRTYKNYICARIEPARGIGNTDSSTGSLNKRAHGNAGIR
jgi:hypothetical protein